MKSFKNFYIRNNNLAQLQNISFETPLITTNSYLYYKSFTQTQKDNFKWTGGGNWLDPQGPVMVNGVTVWGSSNSYPIWQSMYRVTIKFIYTTIYVLNVRTTYDIVLLSY